ncbi:hypothetical protein [Aminobacter sp. LjRoot7]|uniref:hypothetical protein n=1 Tax=Aminobacter sp. LjRoot7 TaxID=3342335 RepID=UPI003ECF1B3F
MARLPPSTSKAIRLWLFRIDLEDLEDAYAGAIASLAHREAEVEEMVRRQLGLGPEDEFPPCDPDDPEDPISEIYERASDMDARTERGGHLIRKTFLIALFHLWERHKKPRIERGAKLGFDRARVLKLLDDLEAAANCAKHPPGGPAKRIFARRPDLFPRVTEQAHVSERTLHITPAVLQEFFEAVWASLGVWREGSPLVLPLNE